MTVRETLRGLAPVIGEDRATRLWHVYLASSSLDRRDLECTLEAYAARVLKDSPIAPAPGLFPPPPPAICAGEIALGNVKYADQRLHPFSLRKQELLRHVGIYGSSGSGKSNGIALVLDGLFRLKTPFLLCDFKRTFRSLLEDYPQLLIYTAGDDKTSPFHFNPLIPPPGTGLEVWSKKVIGALSHAYCQGAGSESLLLAAMTTSFNDMTGKGRWPTFRDVTKTLEEQPARGRKGMWMDSARRAAASVSTGGAAAVFCPERSLDMSRLLAQPVLLELDLLNQAEQTFLSEVLLLWVIQYRMHNNLSRESLSHAIIIEEAHHLLRSPPGMGDGSDPVIHIALREVRELGEAVILATQNSSVVPVAVFGNQATTLAFHTKHQKDVSSTAQAMLLRDEAKDELGRLPVGEAIVRVPRWPDPVHISLEYRPIAKGTVSDAQIRRHMGFRTDSADTAPFRSPPAQNQPNSRIPVPDEKKSKYPESPSAQAASNTTDLASPTTTPVNQDNQPSFPAASHLEMAMLKDIIEHPFDGVVKRIKRLQTSRRKGTASLKALEDHAFLTPVQVFTGSSLIKLFDITATGRAFCDAHNLGRMPAPTAGGVEHRFWVRHIAATLSAKGWQTMEEHRVSEDVIIDVHAENGDCVAAILYETGKSHIKENLIKTLRAGYKEVWVCSTNPQVLSLASKVPSQSSSPVTIRFIAPDKV